MKKWDVCTFHVNEDDLEGRICYGGLEGIRFFAG